MQIRSFRGSGEPAWVNAPKSAPLCLGPDPRRALGPAAIPAAQTDPMIEGAEELSCVILKREA
jgi:hypothetical protein